MNTRWLKARQTKYATFAAVYILVIAAIIVAVNVLGDRYNKSYDSTANKQYSLSDQTAKILKGLTQDATITYFGQGRSFRQARQVLDGYGDLSHKVHIEYVDVDKNPTAARENNIDTYGAVIVRLGAKKEQARSLTEEDVTGAFIRTLKDKARLICFVSGSGEHAIEDRDREGFSALKELLSKEDYSAKSINLLEKAEVPAECTVVIVGGPTRSYFQPAVDALKKYVESGGHALFLLDAPLKIGRSQIADNDTLLNLLQDWGVTADKDLILDPVGQLVGLGPQFTLVQQYSRHPIVSALGRSATGLPFSRSLEIKSTTKTNVQQLFATSESAFATTKLDSTQINPGDPGNRRGPLPVGAAGTYDTGQEKSQGRFVVVGSSGWATNSYITLGGNANLAINNADLALDTVNWLASDEDLISIRPKNPEDRPITMSDSQMHGLQFGSLLLLPGAIIVAGVMVWMRRR